MELRAHDGATGVDHALVAAIVQVDEILFPVRGRDRRHVDCVSVILGSNVAATCREIEGGDVVRTIAVLQFYRLSAGSEREELVSETNAHDGASVRFHKLTQMVDSLLTMCRVARAVTDEHAIKVVSDLVDGVVPREAGDARTTGDERAEDVLLHATINDGDVAVTVAGGDVERSLGGYFLN